MWKRTIEPHCEYYTLHISAGIDSLCKFVSCFKGQRWIVQEVHMCKGNALGLILMTDFKFGV